MRAANTENVESLRSILERMYNRPYEYDEAQDVGEALLRFFEILAAPADESL